MFDATAYKVFCDGIRNSLEIMYDFVDSMPNGHRSAQKVELLHTVMAKFTSPNGIIEADVESFGSVSKIRADYTDPTKPNGVFLYGLVKAPIRDFKSNKFNYHNTAVGESCGRILNSNVEQIIHFSMFLPRVLKGKGGKTETITTLGYDLSKSEDFMRHVNNKKVYNDVIFYESEDKIEFEDEGMIRLFKNICEIRNRLSYPT